ncbi:MAG: NAD(P)-dependent oxidoreductase [Methylobacteriaceae bacterium]|nr:NAD(P)-dependent oxidoreductase [Methylobacteriaceae bacterium]
MRIAFIGYGEVGQTFARQFLARGDVQISAYDILFERGPLAERAREARVTPARNEAEAARDADIVISAVTADAVLDVAREAQGYLKRGQYFFDVNSASPNTKTRAAKIVNKTGGHYVEGAVMAAVLTPGIAVPILAGGPAAADLAARMNAIGMNIRAVSAEYGRASAMKLCRSIVMKGLEVMTVECGRAAAFFDVADEVFGSLEATYPGMGWAALAENSLERVSNHGLRRAAEMREAADMIADMGGDPSLARAIADAQERGAAAAMPEKIKKTA